MHENKDKFKYYGKFGQDDPLDPEPQTRRGLGPPSPSRSQKQQHPSSRQGPARAQGGESPQDRQEAAPGPRQGRRRTGPAAGSGQRSTGQPARRLPVQTPGGFLEGVAAFEHKYLDAEGLNAPLPEWRLVCQMLRPTRTWSSSSSSSSSSPPTPTPTTEPLEKKGVVEVWTRPEYPDLHTLGGWDVNYHYARFVARVLAVVRDPSDAGSQLVHWVRDAKAEDAWWVLFHALLYLQFETMRERIRNAPLRHRIMAMMRSS
ncbi:hypothetical protein PG996_008948 [Apiospora saccharicola]|uniref:Uncharacterized protein n=1 Tax=Apiospora saccharicola TaxID=335842 RepID=A0ABR1V1Y2_9PEZI